MAGKNDTSSAVTESANSFLNVPVSDLKGVGAKRADLFAQKGITTVLDLFYFFPGNYEDRTKIIPLDKLEDGKPAFIKGTVVYADEENLPRRRKKIFKIIISRKTERLELVWFNVNKNFFAAVSEPGTLICAYGTAKLFGNKKQMYHPDVVTADKAGESPGFLPVYPSIEGIPNKVVRTTVKTAVDNYLDLLIDPVPENILKKQKLPGLKESIRQLHFPDKSSDYDCLMDSDTPFHKRIRFDRFFNLMLKVLYERQIRNRISVPPLKITGKMLKDITGSFPFELTDDQLAGIRSIGEDLAGGRPMNRLVMGDVGTGKTVIAAAAAYMAVKNNLQAALMAPTQLLAEQHMEYFCSLPPEMDFKPVLLTGNLKKAAREEIYSAVKKGDYNIIIGTHALIQDRLIFNNLGLAVIDEQHRFGVQQRASIIEKGKNTHVLSMSATPIPRTIAITLYGDRDFSFIGQYPGSRVPVSTLLVDRAKKRWIFDTLKDCLTHGRQAYVVCPLVDESEKLELKNVTDMAQSLKKILPSEYSVEYIHGQLDPFTKENRLRDFRSGKTNILVATTVIEVGIHVPNATLMIIEHPERLGLAQIHQLRGRIGRDGKGGTCILISPETQSDKTRERLCTLEKCSSGFEIAQKDMEFRGHGEITGIRQSGFSELGIGEILKHHDLFTKSSDTARELFETDPDLKSPESRHIKTMLASVFDEG